MVVGGQAKIWLLYNASMTAGVMRYPEALLAFRIDRNTIVEESEKQGIFMEVMTDDILFG